MRVRNSSIYATHWIMPLVEFASRGVNTSATMLDVIDTTTTLRGWAMHGKMVRESGRFKQWTDTWIPKYPKTVEYVVRLYLPSDMTRVPSTAWFKTPLGITRLWPNGIPLESDEDRIVSLAAHEFRHIWQYKRCRAERRAGKKSKGRGEYDAEKFANRRLNEWRIATGREPVLAVKQPNPFAS